MKFMFFNMAHGINPSGSPFSQIRQILPVKKGWLADFSSNVASIRPDVLALVETDAGSLRTWGVNQPEYIAKEHGYDYAFYPKYNGTFLESFPIYRKHGSAVLYKKGMNVKNSAFYLDHGFKRVVINSNITFNDKPLSLYTLHMSIRKRVRELQLGQLADAVLKDNTKKKLIVGDLNTFSGNGELDNFLSKTGMVLAGDTTPTYPAWNPRFKLDHLITSKGIAVKNFKVENMLLSDHLAFSFEI